jgi:hypothetical protein
MPVRPLPGLPASVPARPCPSGPPFERNRGPGHQPVARAGRGGGPASTGGHEEVLRPEGRTPSCNHGRDRPCLTLMHTRPPSATLDRQRVKDHVPSVSHETVRHGTAPCRASACRRPSRGWPRERNTPARGAGEWITNPRRCCGLVVFCHFARRHFLWAALWRSDSTSSYTLLKCFRYFLASEPSVSPTLQVGGSSGKVQSTSFFACSIRSSQSASKQI